MTSDSTEFGDQDVSYKAAGELPGLNKLTREFYRIMETRREMTPIREMLGGVPKVLVFWGWKSWIIPIT